MGSDIAVWRRVCALAVVLAWAVGFAPAVAETGAKVDALASASAAATAVAQPGDAAGAPAEGVLLATHSASGIVAVRSWKRLRDERIVKQDLDHSCGAASLATLLNAHFGQQLTEAQLLDAMGRGDAMVSFDDMARALPGFGFRAQGFAANFEQLMRLRQPVIVYVRHRRQSHFSVLRGIDAHTVWLADPSLGNRTFSRSQFLAMWQTRAGKDDRLAGRFLAVLPATPGPRAAEDFFTRAPQRSSAPAVAQLGFFGHAR